MDVLYKLMTSRISPFFFARLSYSTYIAGKSGETRLSVREDGSRRCKDPVLIPCLGGRRLHMGRMMRLINRGFPRCLVKNVRICMGCLRLWGDGVHVSSESEA